MSECNLYTRSRFSDEHERRTVHPYIIIGFITLVSLLSNRFPVTSMVFVLDAFKSFYCHMTTLRLDSYPLVVDLV